MSWKNRRRGRKYLDGYYQRPKRNWNPLRNEFGSFIFYSVLGTIIFLVVYSMWFNPQGTTEFFDDAKDKVSDTFSGVKLNLSDSDENQNTPATKQDSSINSCLRDVENYIEITEAKSPWEITTKIKEYKSFDNTYDALDYLKEWKYIDEDLCYDGECRISPLKTIYIPTFFGYENGNSGEVIIKKYSDVVIVLVRTDVYTGEGKIGDLSPLTCIDGELA